MTEQISRIDPFWPIVPGKGFGPLALGLPLFFLRRAFLDSYRVGAAAIDPASAAGWSAQISPPELELLVIRVPGVVDIFANSFLGKVSGLRARGGYRGRLWEVGGVGDVAGPLHEACERRSLELVELCEGRLEYRFQEASPFWLSLEVGGEEEDGISSGAEWSELLSRPVRAIEIHDDRLRSAMGAYDFPAAWLDSRPDQVGLAKQR